MVIIITKVALVVGLLAAMATGMWTNSRMLRRAREAGYRYWAINPMSALAGLRGIEPLIFVLVPHRALPDLQRMKLSAILRSRRRHRGRYSLGATPLPVCGMA